MYKKVCPACKENSYSSLINSECPYCGTDICLEELKKKIKDNDSILEIMFLNVLNEVDNEVFDLYFDELIKYERDLNGGNAK